MALVPVLGGEPASETSVFPWWSILPDTWAPAPSLLFSQPWAKGSLLMISVISTFRSFGTVQLGHEDVWMGPASAGHKEHSRFCVVWALSPVEGVSDTSQLNHRANFALCTDLYVTDNRVRRRGSPLVRKAAHCCPAASLTLCCLILLHTDEARAAPAGSASSCLFSMCLPLVGRHLELCCALTFCRTGEMETCVCWLPLCLHCKLSAVFPLLAWCWHSQPGGCSLSPGVGDLASLPHFALQQTPVPQPWPELWGLQRTFSVQSIPCRQDAGLLTGLTPASCLVSIQHFGGHSVSHCSDANPLSAGGNVSAVQGQLQDHKSYCSFTNCAWHDCVLPNSSRTWFISFCQTDRPQCHAQQHPWSISVATFFTYHFFFFAPASSFFSFSLWSDFFFSIFFLRPW